MENTEKFGDWTAQPRPGRYWPATCVCGTTRLVLKNDLKRSASTGCGCAARRKTGERSRVQNRKHGFDNTPEMRTWIDMQRRCYQPQRPDYARYGGRGITVCDRWRASFMHFLEDMGRRPEGCTLDRIDNDGPYSPENCRWAERKVQERNKGSNVLRNFNGEQMTVPEAAERYGIKVNTLYNRICNLGWEPSRAVNEPVACRSVAAPM